ncbi:thioredoxin O1, mitochondrial-like [Corylus avellana]|uniref:thioredoxin O1, mitochondrial-like n=1 Tax=Corylus avellana TaxID=13451 RepID=UPI00286CEB41|nr:thioredoxin O1, mitochondrial-like [Corylus avellana]
MVCTKIGRLLRFFYMQEGLGSVLSKLNIASVPTFHFFNNGKKAAEVIGADVIRLKNTMEELYKIEDSEEGTVDK